MSVARSSGLVARAIATDSGLLALNVKSTKPVRAPARLVRPLMSWPSARLPCMRLATSAWVAQVVAGSFVPVVRYAGRVGSRPRRSAIAGDKSGRTSPWRP